MEKYIDILNERFGKDSIMALATVDENGKPWVRTIDAVFYEGSFFRYRRRRRVDKRESFDRRLFCACKRYVYTCR